MNSAIKYLLALSALLTLAAGIVPSIGLTTSEGTRSELDDSDFTVNFSELDAVAAPTFSTTAATLDNFPALGGADVQSSVVRVTVNAGTSFPMHYHPRSAETLIVLEGTMDVSFTFEGMAASARVVTNTVESGNVAIIPESLLHVASCVGEEDCAYIQVTNSADPGAVLF